MRKLKPEKKKNAGRKCITCIADYSTPYFYKPPQKPEENQENKTLIFGIHLVKNESQLLPIAPSQLIL
ncbi:MAG: hypothetical protein A2W91_20150 [Bacteroidetes bacterium GWF2_38_335]|nr:MAG: hypothetical protein A2W91_20150 [Bacteroidetes bacterium GWF2_38_335]HBS86534.1 hypothetical protein [Bacteroidales bacterium]